MGHVDAAQAAPPSLAQYAPSTSDVNERVRLILKRANQGAVLLTVERFYVGNDVTHSTLFDRACACSYENLPKYRSYRVSNTSP